MCTQNSNIALASAPSVDNLKDDRHPDDRYRIADILKLYLDDYITSDERKLSLKDKHFNAINAILACRTDKLGIAICVCTSCGDSIEIKRSCKHRFCPQCGNADTNKWAQSTLQKIMNIKHHHIIVTLPKAFRKLSLMNGDKIHNALFSAAAKAVQKTFIDKFNVKVGIVSVLHTAGADLKYHPHVHMIVSRGGKISDKEEYKTIPGNYLAPQREIAQLFKSIFCKQLAVLFNEDKIKVYKSIQSCQQFKRWMNQNHEKHWIVSIQKPLEDIKQIVDYTGRYTKRACLSEFKIMQINPEIQFKFNDYKNTPRGEKPRVALKTMNPVEFLDSLLLHVPNKGFKMVRYYGVYNARLINDIPERLKGQQNQQIIADINMDELKEVWFDCPFKNLRMQLAKINLPDPLFCKYCNQNKVLYMIKYKSKTILVYEENTS